MSDPNEAKARAKLEEAEKKARKTGGGGFLSSLFSGGAGVGDACELFVQVRAYPPEKAC